MSHEYDCARSSSEMSCSLQLGKKINLFSDTVHSPYFLGRQWKDCDNLQFTFIVVCQFRNINNSFGLQKKSRDFVINIYTRTATSIGKANSNTLIPTAATNARCCPESGLFAAVVKRLKYDKCFYGKDKMRRKHEPTHQFK